MYQLGCAIEALLMNPAVKLSDVAALCIARLDAAEGYVREETGETLTCDRETVPARAAA